jgi:hypothetical protein
LHINDVAKDLILTSLTFELYVKLQNFKVASDMLEYLEVQFGESYLIPEQDINTQMAEVVSIHNEIVNFKQLGLLDAEVNDQFRIDEIIRSMIHSFKEFICKPKGKEVCSSSELVSVAADSMMEPKSYMMVGETSFSEPKGEKKDVMPKKLIRGLVLINYIY